MQYQYPHITDQPTEVQTSNLPEVDFEVSNLAENSMHLITTVCYFTNLHPMAPGAMPQLPNIPTLPALLDHRRSQDSNICPIQTNFLTQQTRQALALSPVFCSHSSPSIIRPPLVILLDGGGVRHMGKRSFPVKEFYLHTPKSFRKYRNSK